VGAAKCNAIYGGVRDRLRHPDRGIQGTRLPARPPHRLP
jgi:hypothetical protein